MADTPIEITEPVSAWLLPLDGDAPCGPDLEYDPAFLELDQAAAGKPETQFSAAEPPVWPDVRERAVALLARSRDLRVALHWSRAQLNIEGLPGLPAVLQLFHGLLAAFWSTGLHPALDPDDEDAFARLSVLGSLDKPDGLLGDLRQALVLPDRRLGGLRVRDVEVAMDRLPARPGERARSLGELQGLFGDLGEICERVRSGVTGSLELVKPLQALLNDRFGSEAVSLKALRLMLEAVRGALPEVAAAPAPDEAEDAGGDSPEELHRSAAPARRGGGMSSIDTREDAIRGIRLICDYLERTEPTNPAQLLLRRAERLIEANFLQLIRELAPDAAAEVARVMGVDPDSIAAIS